MATDSTVYKRVRIDTVYGFGYYNYANYNTIGLEWDTRLQLNRIFSAFFNPTYYFRVTRDEYFDVAGTAGSGEVIADAEPQLGLTYEGNLPYSIPNFFFSAGLTAGVPIRDLLNTGITPIVRYQGNTRYYSVKDAEGGGRIGYDWETDIFLMDLKAWVAGTLGTAPYDLSLNITNLFNNTEVVGFSSGAQAAMHLPGIHYEGKLTVRF